MLSVQNPLTRKCEKEKGERRKNRTGSKKENVQRRKIQAKEHKGFQDCSDTVAKIRNKKLQYKRVQRRADNK